MDRLLLCTDLDRTLIPNGEQPESAAARSRFAELARQPQVSLAYVSGRHLALVEEAIETYRLPLPDFIVADVGSTIYERGQNSHWGKLQAWEDSIGKAWRSLTSGQLQPLLTDMPQLRLQEAEKQNTHKLSYYLPLDADQKSIMAEVDQRLKANDIAANLIWSIDEPAQVGLLDILPAGANKLHAIECIIREQRFEREQTLFAGDSGNDLDVLLSAIPSVLVANADDEVRSAVAAAPPETLHIAQGGFLGMNGNYSAGILEGVAHFHPELLPAMETAT